MMVRRERPQGSIAFYSCELHDSRKLPWRNRNPRHVEENNALEKTQVRCFDWIHPGWFRGLPVDEPPAAGDVQSADDRGHKSADIEASIEPVTREQSPDESAHDRADDAEHVGLYPPLPVIGPVELAGDSAREFTKNDRSEKTHAHSLPGTSSQAITSFTARVMWIASRRTHQCRKGNCAGCAVEKKDRGSAKKCESVWYAASNT